MDRSFRAAGRNLLLAAIIVFVSCAICESIVIVKTQFITGVDAQGNTITEEVFTSNAHLFRTTPRDLYRRQRYTWPGTTWKVRVLARPSWAFISPAVLVYLVVCLTWICPGCIGIWTQIRRGLPKFAQAPRTIVSAANYESHRVLYYAVLAMIWLFIDVYFRQRLAINTSLYEGCFWSSLPVCHGLAAMGWIGPLRSDYTGQLVRSRLHVARIVIMYAFVAPAAFAGTFAMAFAYLL